MSDIAAPISFEASSKPNLTPKSSPATAIIFILLLGGGILYTAYKLYGDVQETGVPVTTYLPFLLLGVALLIALGFEFVNGFHGHRAFRRPLLRIQQNLLGSHAFQTLARPAAGELFLIGH